MPARTDIDPVEIPGLLPNLILIDVERGERNRYRFRLYGTEVCAIRGADLTGRYIEEPGITQLRDAAIESYDRIVADRKPVYQCHKFQPDDYVIGYYHRLVLPLGEQEEVRMLLIGFYRVYDRPAHLPPQGS
ncbi:hypothetical protein P24_07036 [Oceanibaculum indicum P24]|uniref:PAS domain-containing protein n=3 Tax=Oceanibaculum TaxID=659693 RepID=K2JNS1_9PROT|nr:hypothetical protein P24_07036 [Oceanibaculum indicum P24]